MTTTGAVFPGMTDAGETLEAQLRDWLARFAAKDLSRWFGCEPSTAESWKKTGKAQPKAIAAMAARWGEAFLLHLYGPLFMAPEADFSAVLKARLEAVEASSAALRQEMSRAPTLAIAASAAPALAPEAGGFDPAAGRAVAGWDGRVAVGAAPRRAGWLARARRGMTGLAVALAVSSGLMAGGFDGDPLRRARTAGTGARAIARAAASYRSREQMA